MVRVPQRQYLVEEVYNRRHCFRTYNSTLLITRLDAPLRDHLKRFYENLPKT